MLTKSDYLKYLQCKKYLWLYKFRKDLLPKEIDMNLEKIFEAGFEVEEYAYKLFSGGVNAGGGEISEAITKSAKYLKSKESVIFQATVSGQKLFCRADIVKYNKDLRAWDIIEVKSATDAKDLYIDDLAFQKLCFEAAGFKVANIYLIHINNKYVKNGEIIPNELLTMLDLTEKVELRIEDIKQGIHEAFEVLQMKNEPDIRIGWQCENPFTCPFIPYCWKDVPEHSVYSIASKLGVQKLEHLFDEGILEVKDIPLELLDNEKLIKHYHAVVHNAVHIEKDSIKEELSQIEYPIYFLDYETYSPVIPMIDGYKPYQRVVFQYSLHVKESPDAELKHHYFLAENITDPSKEMAQELEKIIGAEGTIIAWNMSFEKGCNIEMGERVPEYKDFFKDINMRMFDLMQVFRKGFYVHKDFQGSASLKKVLPVLVPDLSYKELDIQEGVTASNTWGDMFKSGFSNPDKENKIKELLAYCELDTLAMVRILEELELILKDEK